MNSQGNLVVRSLAVLGLCFSGCSSQPDDLVGDWSGALDVRGTQLRIVLHVTGDPAGQLNATLDSVDQGTKGIPVASFTRTGGRIIFVCPSIKAYYEGDVLEGGAAISGTWTQGDASAPLAFRRVRSEGAVVPDNSPPSEIDGAWNGTLNTSQGPLRVAIRIRNTSDGLSGSLDSVDQGASGIPATKVSREGPQVRMEFSGIGAAFEGTLSEGMGQIEGTWIQNGRLPFTLVRSP